MATEVVLEEYQTLTGIVRDHAEFMHLRTEAVVEHQGLTR
jgi:hypothetical protein